MRALVQRVTQASVTVEGQSIGQIKAGLVILVCAMQGDEDGNAAALAARIARLRIFQDDAGKMNLSLRDTGGSALVISQFTLAADTRRGNRPGFSSAAPPEAGERLYESFVEHLRGQGIVCETGRFGASMRVSLINDGPVTLWLEG